MCPRHCDGRVVSSLRCELQFEVLLLMWTSNVDLTMQVELLELFSGEARVSQAFREAGVSYVSYDCIYDPTGRSMNFLSPGGFALRAQIYRFQVCMQQCTQVDQPVWLHPPRLAMACVMRELEKLFLGRDLELLSTVHFVCSGQSSCNGPPLGVLDHDPRTDAMAHE